MNLSRDEPIERMRIGDKDYRFDLSQLLINIAALISRMLKEPCKC
jgi:hypothetical protein